MTSAEGRLARWRLRLRLAEFEFDVEYKKGKRHVIADALSRMATRSGDETEIPDEIPCFDAANIVEPHADAYARNRYRAIMRLRRILPEFGLPTGNSVVHRTARVH